MSFSLNVHGQSVLINEFNKVMRINIHYLFQDPSIPMKDRWEFNCKGFGINEDIIEILMEKKFRLFVHNVENNKNYLIENDVLVKFLNNYNVDYKVRDTKLKILPMSYFKEL